MTFELWLSPQAQADIQEFSLYLLEYDEQSMLEQAHRLGEVLRNIADTPHTWSYFVHTGAPYRACLFRVGRQIQYWIVYTINETTGSVDVLRFWHTKQNPESLAL